MEIILAKSAGFCFGVSRAIEAVYREIGNGDIYTYGPLIHNKWVSKDLEEKGVHCIDNIDDIENGKLVLRTHGVPQKTHNEIRSRGIEYIDGTCPYVKKIHNVVKGESLKGRKIIIIGDKLHPEIIGINGWCDNSAIIISDIDSVNSVELDPKSEYSVVVQTTFMYKNFEELTNVLKWRIKNIHIFNTICDATSQRQHEAYELSKIVDKMIVIGDKKSSNTNKLYEICKSICKNTFNIETYKDLVLNNFCTNDKIGITAGASTPPAIIKGVISTMSATQNDTVQNFENNEELSFQELLDQSFVTLHTGDIVTGNVIQISNEEISVNLGYKSDGVIPRGEYSNDPNVVPSQEVKVGDDIEVFVVRVNDGEGNVLLSKKRLESQKGMEELQTAFNDGIVLTGKVTEIVKGGIIAIVNGVRVFIPSSQVSNRYVEDLNIFKGKDISFNIIEFDKAKRRIIGGRKALIAKEDKEKKEVLFSKISIGQKTTGKVSRLADFGAFIDLGGVDGLIHISEMSWGRISAPKDVLKEGQEVEVIIIDIDKDKGKISLSLKDIKNNPWNEATVKYAVGNIVNGKVVRMVPFGAFVELEPGIDGLVHISQIASKHVTQPEDELAIGQVIEVKVLDINIDQKKISLSKKEVDSPSDIDSEDTQEESVSEEIKTEE